MYRNNCRFSLVKVIVFLNVEYKMVLVLSPDPTAYILGPSPCHSSLSQRVWCPRQQGVCTTKSGPPLLCSTNCEALSNWFISEKTSHSLLLKTMHVHFSHCCFLCHLSLFIVIFCYSIPVHTFIQKQHDLHTYKDDTFTQVDCPMTRSHSKWFKPAT